MREELQDEFDKLYSRFEGIVKQGELIMWMTDYVREVKRRLRDEYGFTPSSSIGKPPDEDLCFENFPDGDYPMTIEGKLDHVKVINGKFSLCNFDKE